MSAGGRTVALSVAAGVLACAEAAADDRVHATASAGTAVLVTGAQDDRLRFDAVVTATYHRLGGLAGWRAFDGDHDGIVTFGVVFEAAIARPKLVLALHPDLGWNFDQGAPVVGGGVRTTLFILGSIGIGSDVNAYMTVDGIDDSRLALQLVGTVVLGW